MGRSKSGTRSLMVRAWRLIGKCLRPLPDKWKGLTDQEARVRARYVDLAINTEARDLIRARSGVLHAIRETLVGKGFLEVETPILQQIHGGANARPFLTHINAYDLDLYLRIAPELYLKRLCVGGVERVFELGPRIPQRGRRLQPQPRVHAAGGLPGACRLQRVDRRLPRADPERRAGRQRRARVHASPRRTVFSNPSTSPVSGR